MAQQTMYSAIVNSPQTELAADITAVATTFDVLDGAALPAAPNLATIGNDETAETILYTGLSGNTLSGVTRGFQSVAKAWTAGNKIARMFTARDHDTFKANIEDLDLRVLSTEEWFSGMARQAIINGNFDIWQRGTSFTNPTALYTADRFKFGSTGEAGMPTLTHTRQQILGGLQGSAYFYRLTTSGAGSGFGVDTEYVIAQPIENGTRYLCGQDKKLTLSFYARSDIPGKRIGVSLGQRYGTGGSPTADEILPGAIFNLTSSWTKFSFTFNANTLSGKSFGTNNDDYIMLKIWMAWGTNKASINFGGGTAESFGGAGNIDLAQVQLNAGESALPFQPRSFAEELALCQRYYEKSYELSHAPGTSTNTGRTLISRNYSDTAFYGTVYFKTRKRVAPTLALYKTDGTIQDMGGVASSETNIDVNQLASSTLFVFQWTADAEL